MNTDSRAFEEAAELLKALAHPVRLCIVNGLLAKGSCNVSFMQDCLGLPQSTVSQHLQKLRAAGIVQTSRSGLEVHYTIADERVKQLAGILLKEETPS
ncbi:ArsR/SmtB family transcription factor [Paenibacillus pasadenensis]|uniref:Transcriptional regulator, ArsR family n=1 Tax=Paenibacillus pasadenensis TaxID=217090 RepID=A0A2N5N8P6_9BACL|nr:MULTISPECIES: metalloregulator ArsR/SmtB family transcription factor [Paenibacillus]PLT46727.1 Transcriptional regulator, ArsR family [Paenibacillus pasadenensis]QGG57113.1 metalloregulator ArsR/SmtB family transcription factor [Paenibacillus sp. B01]